MLVGLLSSALFFSLSLSLFNLLMSICIVRGLCPGGTSDDVQCCVIPQNDDSPTNGNKDLKNYDHTTTDAAVVGGDGSGPPMDFEYDETAETESVPRYEDQGIEVEKFRFPAQDLGLVDSRVGGSWRVQG